MKRILQTFVAVLLLSTNAFAASFEIDKNPDYRSSLIDSGNTNYASYKSTYADTQNPVTYDNKSAKIGNLFDNKWQDGYGFSWVTGASGKAEDWAPCITAVTNETSTTSGSLYLFYQGGDHKLKEGGGTICAEFDIKVNTTNDRVLIQDIAKWTAISDSNADIFLGEDGKVAGTGYTYRAGEWMHFKMTVDFDASKWNVWMDGTQIINNMPIASKYSWDKNTRFRFRVAQVSAKSDGDIRAGFAVDNFLAYAVGRDISKHVTLEFLNSDGSPLSSGESANSDSKIKLHFESGFDASLLNNENIIIENENGASIPYEASSDGTAYVITPLRKLNYESTYRVRISDELRKSKCSYRPPVGSISFKTGNNRDVVIDTWALSSAEGTGVLAANATLINNTGADFDAAVTIVFYNDKNGVISIARKNHKLISGKNVLGNALTIGNPYDTVPNAAVRIFVTPANSYRIIDEDALKN